MVAAQFTAEAWQMIETLTLDLTLILFGGADWKIKMWDAATHETQKIFSGHNNSVRAMAWMPSSLGSADGELWNPLPTRILNLP